MIFTDDDDLWHPERSSTYLRFYEQLLQGSQTQERQPFANTRRDDISQPKYRSADVEMDNAQWR